MTVIPATCELWVDGARYPDGYPGQDPTLPSAVSGLTVAWGRENSVDQPAAATCTFTVLDPPGGARFDETVALGAAVVIWSELAGQRQVVYGGRITDLTARYDAAADAAVCDVIAADLMADLGNRFVGAEPWAAQTLLARAQRILTAVGVSTAGLTVAARPAGLTVSRMDVDRQPAAQLLTELAVTAGAVLWSAYDPALGGPYLYFEDPATRASLYVFAENVTTLLWGPVAGAGAGTPLSACEVLRDPVHWSRAVTDLITRVAVRWQDQTTTPGTTERSVQVVDGGAEVTYGARGLSIGTLLTTATDATSLATGTLAANAAGPTWRTTGLTWDLGQTQTADQATLDLAWSLLGGVTRLGYAVALGELPYWTPTGAAVQLYIEGGSYRYEADGDGGARWVLALNGSPAAGLGGSLTYGATDRSVRYLDVNRSVTFMNMIGVGPAGATGKRWDQLVGAWDAQTAKWSEL